jgi:hypothetical protein
LDQRFRATDEHGVYVAHQPVYGFRVAPSEPGHLERYAITWRILERLSHLQFSSLLDAGGAEGYKAALIREVFGARVVNCDLSHEAAVRARELFGVPGLACALGALPFRASAFDVVLCSEVLEHLEDYRAATVELLRVARCAVVITVPQEPEDVVARNIASGEPHAHIQALRPSSFDFSGVARVECVGVNSALLKPLRVLGDADEDRFRARFPPALDRVYRAVCRVARRTTGARAAAALVALDGLLSRSPSRSAGLAIVLLKDASAWRERAPRISPSRVVGFKRPAYRPALG